MSCFGSDPVHVMVELFSSLSQNRQVSSEVTFSSFSNPVSLLLLFMPRSVPKA